MHPRRLLLVALLAACGAFGACTSSSTDEGAAPAGPAATATAPTPRPRPPPPADPLTNAGDGGACSGQPGELYALSATKLGGAETVPLCTYQGRVLLIVNTASFCGFTPQLTPLQALYEKYAASGFVVLGFPSNSFAQEYDADTQVSTVCTSTYHITFPMFTIASVIVPDEQPVFAWLNAQPGMDAPVLWNFEKFVISKHGEVAQRFLSAVDPSGPEVPAAIEAELAKP